MAYLSSREEIKPVVSLDPAWRLDGSFDLIMYVMFEALKHKKEAEVEKDLEGWVRKRRAELDAKEID